MFFMYVILTSPTTKPTKEHEMFIEVRNPSVTRFEKLIRDINLGIDHGKVDTIAGQNFKDTHQLPKTINKDWQRNYAALVVMGDHHG